MGKQFPLYEENAATVRVSGGSQYFELYNRIKAKLKSVGKAEVVFMGPPPAWQFVQSMCVVQQNLSFDITFSKFNLKTNEGPRKGVVITLTNTSLPEELANETEVPKPE